MKKESIYIKQSRRTLKVSGYKCFDIYDKDKNKIDMKYCDAIQITGKYIMMEIVGKMIHIWSSKGIKIEKLINTLIITTED